MDCLLSKKHLDGYVDGELSPSLMFEFETHVANCRDCQVQVHFAQRLKRSLQSHLAAPDAPPSLRMGVAAVLSQEAYAGGQRRAVQRGGAAVLAAAAAMAIYFAGGTAPTLFGTQQAGVVMPVFGDIVKRHRDPAPTEIETQEPERAARWVGDNLGLRIETVAFDAPQVRLVGARLSHVGSHRAAKLYYSVGDRRLTAVVFEATPEVRGFLQQEPTVRHATVRGRDVTYYSVQGYTVPILEHNGLIYGFTGDMDRQQLLSLIGSAHLP